MFLDDRLANTPRWFFARPADWKMRIPEILRKSVVFLGRFLNTGPTEDSRLTGTGFFVSVPSRHSDRFFVYLVTARHVSAGFFEKPFGIRINRVDGTAVCVQVEKATCCQRKTCRSVWIFCWTAANVFLNCSVNTGTVSRTRQ
jgi:hypothetical protein